MILVYRYGLLAPSQEGQRVRYQMYLAHRYRNTLVEIERGRRQALRVMLCERANLHPFEHAALRAEAVAAEAARAIRAARAATRSRSESEAMREAVRGARAAAREARRALQDARQTARANPAILAEQQRINELAAELRRNARAYSGLYWGTYLPIEAADEAARKLPLYDGAQPNDPKFVRWAGEGSVAVQLQGGLAVNAAFGSNTCLRIGDCETSPVGREGQPLRVGHKDLRTLWLRVGSDRRTPIWARFPMILHRPLPPSGVLKAVAVRLKRIGPREEWSAYFTVDVADREVPDRIGQGAVVVHPGWRTFDKDLRIAVWRGEDERSGELRLTHESLDGLRKPAELRSVREERFHAARDALRAWLATGPVVPDWFSVAATRLDQWRAPGRLAALTVRWRANRFPGDDEVYAALEAWRFKEHHLWQWESSQRSKSLRRRRELYRVFSAELASRYAVLVLEEFDLSAVARLPTVEAEKPSNEAARGNRQLAAVSELRSALSHAFRARAGRVEIARPASSTHACHVCGSIESFDAARQVHHACGACGAVWDQDENACSNILAQWRATCDVPPRTEAGGLQEDLRDSEVAPETRWGRRKRAKRERTGKEARAVVSKVR